MTGNNINVNGHTVAHALLIRGAWLDMEQSARLGTNTAVQLPNRCICHGSGKQLTNLAVTEVCKDSGSDEKSNNRDHLSSYFCISILNLYKLVFDVTAFTDSTAVT